MDAARDAEAFYNERVVTAAWLDEQEFPPLEWTVPGILSEGLGLLVAPPKVGKSWMVANFALACASGGSALGAIPVKQRPVLLMALEDGHRRLQSRFRTLMVGQPLPDGLEVVTRASANEALVCVAEFLRRNRDEAPLVIIDTFGKVKPPRLLNEDSYAADYRIGGALKERIDDVAGGCMLLVHHTRKAESADFIDSVSGTQGIAGSADFVLALNRRRHSDEAMLSVTGRDVPENEYALITTDGRWSLDGQDLMDAATTAQKRREAGDLGDRSLDALVFINGRPSGTRAADLAEHLDIEANLAGNYLRRLQEAGRIAKRSRGLYGPVVEVVEVVETQVEAGENSR
nr:AAA family ATPase [Mycolicibacterium hippocampi]